MHLQSWSAQWSCSLFRLLSLLPHWKAFLFHCHLMQGNWHHRMPGQPPHRLHGIMWRSPHLHKSLQNLSLRLCTHSMELQLQRHLQLRSYHHFHVCTFPSLLIHRSSRVFHLRWNLFFPLQFLMYLLWKHQCYRILYHHKQGLQMNWKTDWHWHPLLKEVHCSHS